MLLKRVGRLCNETGLSHTELNQMPAEKVLRLLAVNDAFTDWQNSELERMTTNARRVEFES